MDRQSFLRSAPSYYGLAIAAYLKESGQRLTYKDAIQNYYTVVFEEDGAEYSHLDIDELFVAGARHAANLGLLEVIKDDFGPDLFKLSDEFWDRWNSVVERNDLPYSKYNNAGDEAKKWLFSALVSIKHRFRELQISSSDFGETDIEWAPIPLEREDTKLKEAVAAIDEVIEDVRGNNGYDATFPNEKSYVIDKLRAVSSRLKQDAQISWIYVREFALEPLSILVRRFGKAATGLLASAARAALREWLKSKGISFLDDIFN